jgi:hypothetical protein
MTMNDLQRSAVVAALVKEYRAGNAFCGETMVQKSVFVLQELLKVPLAFDFQLYIYGPFSFELQRHVSSMMADDMLAPRSLEYGSTFELGEQVAYLEKHTSHTIAAHREAVDFVVKHLANRGADSPGSRHGATLFRRSAASRSLASGACAAETVVGCLRFGVTPHRQPITDHPPAKGWS